MFTCEMYGINALSDKKDAAWTFMEYLLSKEYQTEHHSGGFTIRENVLEEMFEAEMNYDFSDCDVRQTNKFTGEKRFGSKVAPFTEEADYYLRVIKA